MCVQALDYIVLLYLCVYVVYIASNIGTRIRLPNLLISDSVYTIASYCLVGHN